MTTFKDLEARKHHLKVKYHPSMHERSKFSSQHLTSIMSPTIIL